MKKVIELSLAATMFILVLVSCQKETSIPARAASARSSTSQEGQTKGETPFTSTLSVPDYVACGMKLNLFTPHPYVYKQYSFAIDYNGQRKKVRLYNGQVYFNNPDKFSFESAGYADMAKTVPAWRIKRTDGQYLTSSGNGFEYAAKLTGTNETRQVFLLSDPAASGLTKVILPKFTVCSLMAIWFDIDYQNYHSYTLNYNDPKLVQSVPVYMLENELAVSF